ncbi:hypothetical protein PFISCL1PPCAC_18737, partial [Pristionchus fissidentatus]
DSMEKTITQGMCTIQNTWEEECLVSFKKDCPEGASCKPLVISHDKKKISCPEDLQLRYSATSSSTPVDTSFITCESGTFSDQKSLTVPPKSTVYCQVPVLSSTEAPVAAASVDPSVVGGAVGGTLFLLLIAAVVAF